MIAGGPRMTGQGLGASPVRNLAGGILFVLVVTALAVGAYCAEGWSFADALYMSVLTVFTVGYGEVHPIDTEPLRLITMGLIVFGCTGMIFLTGALVQFITVRSFQDVLGTRRNRMELEKLAGHTIICGHGRIGRSLVRDLQAASARFVVLEADPARAAELRADGHLVLQADATEEEALAHAGIARARVLATVLPNDAANVFITLSARAMNPALTIIARGEAPATERKLLQAGANHVVLPAHIGAERMAELILYPATLAMRPPASRMREMGRDLHRFGLELVTVIVAPGSRHAGRTMAEVERATDCFVVTVEQPGSGAAQRPEPEQVLAAGDGVTLMGPQRHGAGRRLRRWLTAGMADGGHG